MDCRSVGDVVDEVDEFDRVSLGPAVTGEVKVSFSGMAELYIVQPCFVLFYFSLFFTLEKGWSLLVTK